MTNNNKNDTLNLYVQLKFKTSVIIGSYIKLKSRLHVYL